MSAYTFNDEQKMKKLAEKINEDPVGVTFEDWVKFDQDLYRFNELDDFAWYGACFGHTRRILTTAIPTACVGYKGSELFFAANPHFLWQMTFHQRCMIYCHEIDHIVRSHLSVMHDWPERMGELNIVMDALINEALLNYNSVWSKGDLPKWKSKDGKESGLIDFEALKKMIESAKGQGGTAAQELPNGMSSYDFYRELTSEGLLKYLPRVPGQDRASQSIFEKIAEEMYGPGGEFFDDGSVPDEVKDSMIEEMVDSAQKSRGHVPAHLQSYLDKIHDKSNRNYRMMMRGLGRSTHIKVTRSWVKWNKRNPTLSMPLRPGRYFKSRPKVLVMADTSGSVGNGELAAFMKEINGLTEKCIIDMAWVDAHFDAKDPKIFYKDIKNTQDFIKRGQNPVGRGGTYFKEFYNYALENYGMYQHILILTDGYADDIPKRLVPGQQLLLMTPSHSSSYTDVAREHGFKVAVIEDL